VTRAGDDPVVIIECSVELPSGNVLFNGSMHLGGLADGAPVPVVGNLDTDVVLGAEESLRLRDLQPNHEWPSPLPSDTAQA
jgi:hypothetical protein